MRRALAVDPYDDTGSLFGSIAHAVSGAAKGISKGVDAVGNKLSKVPLVGAGLKGLTTITIGPYQAALNVAAGQRIDRAALNSLKSQVGAAKAVAPYVQSVISFVPGVGQGMSGAISASLALAEGKPINEAVLAAAKGALPGGPMAAAAFDVAAAAAQGKPLTEVALAAVPISPTQRDILRQSLAVAKDVASGKKVDSIVMNRVNDNLKKLPPVVQKAAQVGVAMGHAKNLQDALKTGAKGAVSIGVSTLTKGKNMNPFIAAAKNLGSSQSGIQKAIGAAQALKNNSPVLTKALSSAAGHIAQGSHEHVGFNTAVNVLKQTAGNKAALGAARRALPSAQAQHGFDAAIGVVSHAVSKTPALVKRAGSSFVPQLGKKPGVISPYQPNLKHAIDSIKKNPTLANQHPLVLANKFGTSQQVVLQALKKVSTERLLPWRSLSPAAARFVKKWHPNAPLNALTHGTGDTAGLDETGTKYIVEKGDFPFKIAQKLTGNGNRWVELKPLNKDKKPDITKNVWVGEVLNIPASWQKPVTRSAPAPQTPAVAVQPSPEAPAVVVTPAPVISVVPGTLQAKSILVAWSKTDGVNQAGVPDYGSTAADLSTDFGSRDSLELMAFQNWDNKTANAGLVVDGKLGPKSLAALQNWAERRATQVVPATPTVQTSIPGQVTTLPEVVIEGSSPVPVSAPVVVAPSPSTPAPAMPPVASPGQPATAATVAAATPPSGSKMAPALAGAAVGGVLFGLPGAIIGGIAGAAMA